MDNNGYLEHAEAKQFIANATYLIRTDRAENFDPANFDKIFNEFDEDQNGYLDKGELATLIKKVFRNN